MRDYTGLNYCYAKKYLNDAINSTKHNYKRHFNTQDVPGKYHYLKNQSLSVGDDANSHIASIRSRLSTALDLLETFHKDVDTASSNILASADNIVAVLNEVNGAMDRINNALSGLGDYKGKTISANDIKVAGIDESKCKKLIEKAWDAFMKNDNAVTSYIDEMKELQKNGQLSPEDKVKLKNIFDWYAKNQLDLTGKATLLTDQQLRNFVDVFKLLDSADLTDKMLDDFMKNDAAVAMYLEDMKSLTDIPADDMAKLNRIYEWYVNNRYGSTGNVNDMDEQTLKNCVDAYELINPNAKAVTDEFFSPAFGKNTPTVDLNILKIKYGIYTCDPKYRDTLLGYLPHMKLNPLSAGDDGVSCSHGTDENTGEKLAILNLDLYRLNTGNFCSFFHEAGHGIDYLTGEPSQNLPSFLIKDVRDELRKTIEAYNSTLPIDKRLSQDGIDKLLDYFLDTTCNPNVVLKNGDAPSLPDEWCQELKDVYVYVRAQYGYYDYVYNDSARYSYKALNGLFTGDFVKDGILIDVMGGITNNKICGGMGGGHHYGWDSGSVRPSTYKDFQTEIATKSYYYLAPGGNPMYDTEFYAEVFEYRCLNRDLSATEKVFGESIKTVDGYISDAYDKVK